MPVLPEIIGEIGSVYGPALDNAPPGTEMREELIRSMPIISLYPKISRNESGTEILTLEEAHQEYISYLENAGITVDPRVVERGLKVMYQNNASISENYSNNFSQSQILDSISNGAMSQTAQDLMQISGGGFSGNLDKLKARGGLLGNAAESFDSMTKELNDLASEVTGNAKLGNQLQQIMTNPDAKIDFPMLWRSSNYSANYSFNVRLFNPFPRDDAAYGNLIAAPLAALLAFVLPRSTDGGLYKWPFLCSVKALGRFKIQAGYIQSLSVVKGGDQNDFGFNLRPNLVDIQMTIGNLYNVMLMTEEGDVTSDAPTLKREIAALMTQRKITDYDTILGAENAHIEQTQPGSRFPFSPPSNIQNAARQLSRVVIGTDTPVQVAANALRQAGISL